MAKLTAEQYAEKQARNLKNSLPDIRAGIERVSTAPGVAAAAAQTRMNKGVDRIAAGIDQAHDKQVAMAGRLLSAVDSAASKANSMPKGSISDSIARMTSFVEDMHKFKGKI